MLPQKTLRRIMNTTYSLPVHYIIKAILDGDEKALHDLNAANEKGQKIVKKHNRQFKKQIPSFVDHSNRC